MKKNISVLITILFIMGVAVLGCSKKTDKPTFQAPTKQKQEESKEQSAPTEYQFEAVVLAIDKESLMVQALEGQNVAGEVKVWIGLLEDTEMSGIKVGDTVRITHDGKMTMSIPPQMSAVELTVLSKAGDI